MGFEQLPGVNQNTNTNSESKALEVLTAKNPKTVTVEANADVGDAFKRANIRGREVTQRIDVQLLPAQPKPVYQTPTTEYSVRSVKQSPEYILYGFGNVKPSSDNIVINKPSAPSESQVPKDIQESNFKKLKEAYTDKSAGVISAIPKGEFKGQQIITPSPMYKPTPTVFDNSLVAGTLLSTSQGVFRGGLIAGKEVVGSAVDIVQLKEPRIVNTFLGFGVTLFTNPLEIGYGISQQAETFGWSGVAGEFGGQALVYGTTLPGVGYAKGKGISLELPKVYKFADVTSKQYQSWMLAKTIIEPELKGQIITRESFNAAILERGLSTQIAVRPIEGFEVQSVSFIKESGDVAYRDLLRFDLGKSELVNPSDLPLTPAVRLTGEGIKGTILGKGSIVEENPILSLSRAVGKSTTEVGALRYITEPVKVDVAGTTESFLSQLGKGSEVGGSLVYENIGLIEGFDATTQKFIGINVKGNIEGYTPKISNVKDIVPKPSRASPRDFGLPQDQLSQDFLRVGSKSSVPELFFESEPIDLFAGKGFGQTSVLAKIGEGRRFYVFEGVKLAEPVDLFKSVIKTPTGKSVPLFTTIDLTGTKPTVEKPTDVGSGVSGTGQVSVQKLVSPTTINIGKTKTKTDLVGGVKYGTLTGTNEKQKQYTGESQFDNVKVSTRTNQDIKDLYTSKERTDIGIMGGVRSNIKSGVDNVLSILPDVRTNVKPITDVTPIIKPGVGIKISSIPSTSISSKTATDIMSIQTPVVDTPQINIPGIIPGRIIPPTRTNIPLFTSPLTESKPTKKKYKAKVRRRGRWLDLGTFGSVGEAVQKGVSYNLATAGRSFKVTTEGGETVDIGNSDYRFRPAKKESGVFVQLPKFSISSFGEKQEISRKGQQSKKNKRGFKIGKIFKL